MQNRYEVLVRWNSFLSKYQRHTIKTYGIYIPEHAMYKQLLQKFHKIKVCGGIFFFKFARIHFLQVH